MVAVEVRQGTLSADGRGRGPAGNTGHSRSQLRSGREHCAQMVAVFAVQVRQGTLDMAVGAWGLTARRHGGAREGEGGEGEGGQG